LEADLKRLTGFYNFNKSALISEFSMKEFFSFLEKNRIFLQKHYEDYSRSSQDINISDKISKIISFDETKMNFSSKNYLPKNQCKLYQPIDRTNQIIVYDAESEHFRRVSLYPKKLSGFSFLPFSRYLNFNGRLIVSGGYDDTKMSRTFWAIEDRSKHVAQITTTRKTTIDYTLANHKTMEFGANTTHLSNKNFAYEDENNSGIMVVRCANMIFARAGHAMLGINPTLVLVFGGSENVRTCEVYHFDSNRWEEISSLNEARIDPSAFVYKNFIYVFFGLRFEKSSKKYTFLDTIERISLLNMQQAEWEYITPKCSDNLPHESLPRSLCGIVLKANSTSSIYLCGGQVDKENYSNDIFEYDIEQNFLSAVVDKKLPKPSAFLEQNFLYLYNTGVNFDIYGDLFYYHQSDSFNFYFQKLFN
jgi:hypothetical protein